MPSWRVVLAAAVLAACTSPSPPATSTSASTSFTTSSAPPLSTTGPVTPAPSPRSTAAPPGPCGGSGPVGARYEHVVWIWMENHTATSVLTSDQAPFEQ